MCRSGPFTRSGWSSLLHDMRDVCLVGMDQPSHPTLELHMLLWWAVLSFGSSILSLWRVSMSVRLFVRGGR